MRVGVKGFGKLGSMLHPLITSPAFEETTLTCERCRNAMIPRIDSVIPCNRLQDSPCCTFHCARNVAIHIMPSRLWHLRAAAVDWTSAVRHPALQHSSFSFFFSFLSSD